MPEGAPKKDRGGTRPGAVRGRYRAREGSTRERFETLLANPKARALLWYVFRHGGSFTDAVAAVDAQKEECGGIDLAPLQGQITHLFKDVPGFLIATERKFKNNPSSAESINWARSVARPLLEARAPGSFWRYEPYTAALAYHWIAAGASMRTVAHLLELYYGRELQEKDIEAIQGTMRRLNKNAEGAAEWEAAGKPEGQKLLWLLRRASHDDIIEHARQPALDALHEFTDTRWQESFADQELFGNPDACALVAELLERNLSAEAVAAALELTHDIKQPWWRFAHMKLREKGERGFVTERLRRNIPDDVRADARDRADIIEAAYEPLARRKSGSVPLTERIKRRLEALHENEPEVATPTEEILPTEPRATMEDADAAREREAVAILKADPVFERVRRQLNLGKSPDVGTFTFSVGTMLTARDGDKYETGLGMVITPLPVSETATQMELDGSRQQAAFLKRLMRAIAIARENLSRDQPSEFADMMHSLALPIERIIIRQWFDRSYEILEDFMLPRSKSR